MRLHSLLSEESPWPWAVGDSSSVSCQQPKKELLLAKTTAFAEIKEGAVDHAKNDNFLIDTHDHVLYFNNADTQVKKALHDKQAPKIIGGKLPPGTTEESVQRVVFVKGRERVTFTCPLGYIKVREVEDDFKHQIKRPEPRGPQLVVPQEEQKDETTEQDPDTQLEDEQAEKKPPVFHRFWCESADDEVVAKRKEAKLATPILPVFPRGPNQGKPIKRWPAQVDHTGPYYFDDSCDHATELFLCSPAGDEAAHGAQVCHPVPESNLASFEAQIRHSLRDLFPKSYKKVIPSMLIS
ncbi:unnamed protein product [Amoebophrya sp. A120]|nr:unnamed protein product [Amoebophrya sp. A120]|eukprot:GSA120T00011642001.1